MAPYKSCSNTETTITQFITNLCFKRLPLLSHSLYLFSLFVLVDFMELHSLQAIADAKKKEDYDWLHDTL